MDSYKTGVIHLLVISWFLVMIERVFFYCKNSDVHKNIILAYYLFSGKVKNYIFENGKPL